MKTTLFFKKYRFSKRIVIKNTNPTKDDEYKEVTKSKFFEALHLVPVDEICDSIIFPRKKSKAKKRCNEPIEVNFDDACPVTENNNPNASNATFKMKLLPHCSNRFVTAEVPCKFCGKLFSNRRMMVKHKEQRHSGNKPYSCTKCNRAFKTLDLLIGHLRSHEGKLPYECKTCKETFPTFKAYNKHQSVHVLLKIDYPKVKVFKCDSCPKEFRKLCDLERHLRVHTGEKPFECFICKKKFQQAHNMTKHMIIHTNEKHYKCEVCGKEFGRSDVLNRHMITHTVDKPHHCGECPKSFGRISQLNEHVRKHHRKEAAAGGGVGEEVKVMVS